MGLSSKLYLISTDETVHVLASAAYMRMLRRESANRLPDFAGQRVRQASIAVETANGIPTRVVHCTFSVLDFDRNGFLDVDRLLAQQFARVDDPFDPASSGEGTPGRVVDAASRFVARGGLWEPGRQLMRHIEAAALGRVACPRVRVTR